MPTSLALLNIGTFELLLVLVVAVLLFGGDLPEVARKAARLVGRLRAMGQDLSGEFTRGDLGRSGGRVAREVQEALRDVEAEVRRVPEDVEADVDATAPPSLKAPTPEEREEPKDPREGGPAG